MIVYVEGVDGSGKTTLIKQLEEEFGYEVRLIPSRRTSKEVENYAWKQFIGYFDNRTVICDRGFISELVYRLSDTDDTWLNLSDLAILLQKCKIIYCISKTSFTDAQERGEDNIVTFERHKDIENEYENVLRLLTRFSNIPVYQYDWHNTDIKEVVKFINSNKEINNGI